MTDTTEPVARITDAGELIASIPTMVGFHPTGSLVLTLLAGKRVQLTLRVDLPPADQVDDHAEQITAGIRRSGITADRAVVVVVDESGPRWDVIAAIVVRLELDLNITAGDDMYWAQSTQPGAQWACSNRCHDGYLPGANEMLAAAEVLNGRATMLSREDLVRNLAPISDSEALARREEALRRGGRDYSPAATLRFSVFESRHGQLTLTDDRVVGLVRAFGMRDLQAEVIRLMLLDKDTSAAMHNLLHPLVREAPGVWVAQVAAFLALSAMLRGDGALANVAVERALDADEEHSLAGLVRSLLEAGISPAQLREVLSA